MPVIGEGVIQITYLHELYTIKASNSRVTVRRSK